MRSQSDLSKSGVPGHSGLETGASDDGWITIDLDAVKQGSSAEPSQQATTTPVVENPVPAPGLPAPAQDTAAGSESEAPKLEAHNAQDLRPPRAVARLHGWLERLRPSDPGFLSFERVHDGDIGPDPRPERRVPQADIILVGRAHQAPRPDRVTSFSEVRAIADGTKQGTSPEASNDDEPSASSRRRKLLLRLALLLAVTGMLQALMRLTQAPASPAVVDMLTF